MSSDIWTRCEGRFSWRTLSCDAWRVTDSHLRTMVPTRRLVDTDAEHDVLEEMIDGAKPRAGDPDLEGLHYLLFTPFRYPPLQRGSRFGRTHERGLWYGAEDRACALAEVAYYRLLFFEGSAASLAPDTTPFSAFRVKIASSSGVDVSLPPFGAHLEAICSPTSYRHSQPLGSALREHGAQVVRFPSARDPRGGVNLALFTPRAFAARRPLGAPETWECTVTRGHDVEWRHERVTAVDVVTFPRSAFLVGGELPAPCVG